jgi:hypothetical protein
MASNYIVAKMDFYCCSEAHARGNNNLSKITEYY